MTWCVTLRKEHGLRFVGKQSAEKEIWGCEGRGNSGVEKTTYRGALRSVLRIKYYKGDQIKKNEMGGACGTKGGGGKERCTQRCGGET